MCSRWWDGLFALTLVGPKFEPCLGQSVGLAEALNPLCLSVGCAEGSLLGLQPDQVKGAGGSELARGVLVMVQAGWAWQGDQAGLQAC